MHGFNPPRNETVVWEIDATVPWEQAFDAIEEAAREGRLITTVAVNSMLGAYLSLEHPSWFNRTGADKTKATPKVDVAPGDFVFEARLHNAGHPNASVEVVLWQISAAKTATANAK